MATLYVSEYSGTIGNSIAVTPRLALNNIAITAASVASAAFGPNTRVVRLHADAICSVRFSPDAGVTPTATAADQRMAAGQTEYFAVRPGDSVAVIANS